MEIRRGISIPPHPVRNIDATSHHYNVTACTIKNTHPPAASQWLEAHPYDGQPLGKGSQKLPSKAICCPNRHYASEVRAESPPKRAKPALGGRTKRDESLQTDRPPRTRLKFYAIASKISSSKLAPKQYESQQKTAAQTCLKRSFLVIATER